MILVRYQVDGVLYGEDFLAGEEAATRGRKRLVRISQEGEQVHREDQFVPYPVCAEDATHLWIESPLGTIGLASERPCCERAQDPALCVFLRVVVNERDEVVGIQRQLIVFDSRNSVRFTEESLIPLDQIARR